MTISAGPVTHSNPTIHPEPMVVQAITELICSRFASSASTAGVTLVVEPVRTTLWINADVDRVVQAVGNLVGNAIKFTPRGGKVTLAVNRDDKSVRFRIQDSGVGIAPETFPVSSTYSGRRTNQDEVAPGWAS